MGVDLGPAGGAIVQIDGQPVFLRRAGSGDDVVLLHGLPGNSSVWAGPMARFATHHRVTAIDLPGLGYSSRDRHRSFSLESVAETVVRTMDRLGIERAAVIGNSMGGGVAQWLATRHPDRVSRLVLTASVDEEAGSAWAGGWIDLALTGIYAVIVTIPPLGRAVGRRVIAGGAQRPDLITDDYVEGMLRPLFRRGTGACLVRYELDNRRAPRLDASLIGVPTLIINGDRDEIIPVQAVAKLAARISGARTVTVAGATHSMIVERVDEVTMACESFLHPDGPVRED